MDSPDLHYHSSGSYWIPGDPGEPQTGAPRLSVTELEAQILKALVHDHVTLEIGTGTGYSSRIMSETASFIYTYDIDQWVKDTVWPTLPANVKGIEDPWPNAERKMVTAAFIDGDHSTEAVARDLARVQQELPHLTVILAHDVGYDHVRAGLGDLSDWIFIPTTHGIGVKYL